jgi:hypothetical protein
VYASRLQSADCKTARGGRAGLFCKLEYLNKLSVTVLTVNLVCVCLYVHELSVCCIWICTHVHVNIG